MKVEFQSSSETGYECELLITASDYCTAEKDASEWESLMLAVDAFFSLYGFQKKISVFEYSDIKKAIADKKKGAVVITVKKDYFNNYFPVFFVVNENKRQPVLFRQNVAMIDNTASNTPDNE